MDGPIGGREGWMGRCVDGWVKGWTKVLTGQVSQALLCRRRHVCPPGDTQAPESLRSA